MGKLREFERPELSALRSFPVKGFEKRLVFYRPTDHDIEVVRLSACCMERIGAVTNSYMNDICKGCDEELPPSQAGERRKACPHCGATARIIQFQAHAVGSSSARATGIVICPDPVVVEVELSLPPPKLITEEPKAPRKPRLKDRRNAAYYAFLDDIRREPDGSPILDYLVDRFLALRIVMEREADEGRYDD